MPFRQTCITHRRGQGSIFKNPSWFRSNSTHESNRVPWPNPAHRNSLQSPVPWLFSQPTQLNSTRVHVWLLMHSMHIHVRFDDAYLWALKYSSGSDVMSCSCAFAFYPLSIILRARQKLLIILLLSVYTKFLCVWRFASVRAFFTSALNPSSLGFFKRQQRLWWEPKTQKFRQLLDLPSADQSLIDFTFLDAHVVFRTFERTLESAAARWFSDSVPYFQYAVSLRRSMRQ